MKLKSYLKDLLDLVGMEKFVVDLDRVLKTTTGRSYKNSRRIKKLETNMGDVLAAVAMVGGEGMASPLTVGQKIRSEVESVKSSFELKVEDLREQIEELPTIDRQRLDDLHRQVDYVRKVAEDANRLAQVAGCLTVTNGSEVVSKTSDMIDNLSRKQKELSESFYAKRRVMENKIKSMERKFLCPDWFGTTYTMA